MGIDAVKATSEQTHSHGSRSSMMRVMGATRDVTLALAALGLSSQSTHAPIYTKDPSAMTQPTEPSNKHPSQLEHAEVPTKTIKWSIELISDNEIVIVVNERAFKGSFPKGTELQEPVPGENALTIKARVPSGMIVQNPFIDLRGLIEASADVLPKIDTEISLSHRHARELVAQTDALPPRPKNGEDYHTLIMYFAKDGEKFDENGHGPNKQEVYLTPTVLEKREESTHRISGEFEVPSTAEVAAE